MSMTPGWAIERALREDPREAKLPKWVQDNLRILRESWTEQNELAQDVLRRTGPEAAGIVLDPLDEHGGIGIDGRTTVRLKADEDGSAHGYIEVDLRDGWVQVRASDGLEIRPRVSNAIDVRNTHRRGR